MRVFFSRITPSLFGLLMLAVIFILGFSLMYSFAHVIRWAEPFLFFLIAGTIVLFIVYVLPFSLVRKTKGRIAAFAMTLSYVCGGSAWLLSFMFIFLYLKWWVFLLMWVFHITTPLAIIVLLFDSQFSNAAFLTIAFGATYGMRFYALRLAQLSGRREIKRASSDNNDEVIEAEIVE